MLTQPEYYFFLNNRELGQKVQAWVHNKMIKNKDPRQANKNFGALHMEGSLGEDEFH